MAIQAQMTWTKNGQWTRMHKGKRYYIRPRTLQELYPTQFSGPTKEGSYRAANAWWEAKMSELVKAADTTVPAYMLPSNPQPATYFSDGSGYLPKQAVEGQTVGLAIASFLSQVMRMAEIKTRAVSRWYDLKLHLTTFQEHKAGLQDMALTAINSDFLTNYKLWLEEQIAAKKFSAGHANNCMIGCLQFVRWLWTSERIKEMPRIMLVRGALTITVKRGKIKTIDLNEWQTLQANAPEQMKLFLLLFLNCGFTQADIAELRQDEVDWTQGRIIRKRTKQTTKSGENLPVVNYKLWDETFALLKKFRSSDDTRVLLTSKGNPWKVDGVEKGTRKRSDSFASAYRRFKETMAKKNVVLPVAKNIRKTGATKLNSEFRYMNLRFYYLGHADKTMADKHYAGKPMDLFDEAVAWLGEQFGCKTTR